MITPNKVISLDNSAIGLAGCILEVEFSSMPLSDLYRKLERKFESADQFLLCIDALYLLEKIEVDLATGIVTHAG